MSVTLFIGGEYLVLPNVFIKRDFPTGRKMVLHTQGGKKKKKKKGRRPNHLRLKKHTTSHAMTAHFERSLMEFV